MSPESCASDELSLTIETVQNNPNLTSNINGTTEERAILTSSCIKGYKKDSRSQCRKVIPKCIKKN